MILRKSLAIRVVCAMLLTSACQDVPTAPERAAPLPVLSAGGARTGQMPFYCTISRRDSGPAATWRTARFTFHIPRAELHAAGRTVLYQLRRPDASGVEVYRADCTVPYTERALRRVDRAFGVAGEGGAEVFIARQGMITTQGCVEDGVCPIEPILVPAPVKPNKDPDDPCTRYPDQCESGGGGGDGDGEGGDGGGEEPPPATPDDPQDTPSDTTCKTMDPLIDALPIQTAFEELWKKSNYEVNGVIQPQSERREQGGFIISTAAGYTFQSFPSDWAYGPCSISFPLDFRPPAGAVAYVHTHPFTQGEKQISCDEIIPGSGLYQNYPGKSTDGDNKTAGHWEIPGILLDADHIARFTSDEAAPDVTFGRCAY